jgi:hypothetical protein
MVIELSGGLLHQRLSFLLDLCRQTWFGLDKIIGSLVVLNLFVFVNHFWLLDR